MTRNERLGLSHTSRFFGLAISAFGARPLHCAAFRALFSIESGHVEPLYFILKMLASTLAHLDTLGELATPLKFALVNDWLAQLSAAVGFPADQLRALLCFAAAYPLAEVLRRLGSPTAKHWMNIFVGVGMAQFVYGSQWLLSLLSASTTYALMLAAPAHLAPRLVFAYNMALVAALHLYRMYVDYMGWTMDATASQMLLLIKLTSFAYNYHDGTAGAPATASAASDSPALAKLKKTRRELAIRQLPSLLEFFGFVYCFTTFLAGPAFEYREYVDAVKGVKGANNTSGTDSDKRQLRSTQKRVPSSPVRPAMKKLALGLVFIALLATCGAYADVRAALSPAKSLVSRWASVLVALFLTRVKYYTAWTLAEGATILSGAGFEGFDAAGAPKGWGGVSNVDILGFEFAESVRDLTRAWNKGTQKWLERYVYSRTGNSLGATYACSAVWHGFYPGYYLFFGVVPLATAVNRLARRHVRPYFMTPAGDAPLASKWLYDAAGMLATSLVVNYLAVSFVVLSWEDAVAGFQALRFSGHLALVVAYLTLPAVPVRKKLSMKALGIPKGSK